MHLDYLYLPTVADIRGTNPHLWNTWGIAAVDLVQGHPPSTAARAGPPHRQGRNASAKRRRRRGNGCTPPKLMKSASTGYGKASATTISCAIPPTKLPGIPARSSKKGYHERPLVMARDDRSLAGAAPRSLSTPAIRTPVRVDHLHPRPVGTDHSRCPHHHRPQWLHPGQLHGP